MTTGTIRPVRIEDEMRSSYLDYAMSVIVARALPDVRDGLKPVHRRILYAMDETGMRAGTPYRKSARLVGDVMGKYHPHGDAPIYDAMVRLAQDFSMHYPLVDGQGNFGSIDDDPPAAMRYTEARLSAIAQEMVIDIDRDTVDFAPNFDDSLTEPSVLPARLPNLLINGSTGIAVGMTTNVPPHNLTEVCDAIIHLIQNPDAELEDIMQFIHGPDFPTGATILGQSGIREAYLTGRGRVVVRANVDVEEARGNRWNLIVTEIPYMVNKANMVEKIAFLAKTHKIEGISDIRDESSRAGMRVVIELRREAQVQRVKNNLFKHTALQTAFHINMLALVDAQPQTLPIIEVLQNFIRHRYEIIRRRSEFEIRKAQARVHILEGLRTAIANMDAVIALIRGADDADSARQALMLQFSLEHDQAQAILEMQLRRLAALERKRIEDEFTTLTNSIAELQALLADPANVLQEVAQETRKLRDQYGDDRRTAINPQEVSDFTQEELIPHQEVVVTLSQRGYIKCVPADTYRRQHRGGKGVRGQTTREGDSVLDHLVTDNHDTLLFFTNKGRVYRMKVYELHADSSRTTRGTPLVQFLGLRDPESETVSALLDVSSFQEDRDVLFATRMGEIKRMSLSRLANIRSNGLNTMDLEPGDELVSVRESDDADHVIMVSKDGMSIRFPAAQVRRTSRAAGGVRGMRLRPGDQLVAMDIIEPDAQLLVISQRGFGKPTDMGRYRLQSRAGYGLQTFRITSRSGPIATASIVKEGEDIMIISERGQVARTNLSELREKSRRTQGVTIVSLPEGDIVVSITSEEPKARHVRDTTPRPAIGNIQPVMEEPSTELDLDDPTTDNDEEQ